MTSLLAATIIACTPTPTQLGSAISRISHAPKRTRALRAYTLAKRILIEAKRHSLDPIALAAVGSVESDFRPRVKGPGFKPRGYAGRMYEYGTFQLIPRSAPVRFASRLLSRCAAIISSPSRSVALAGRCPAPDVWRARTGRGGFSVRELEDYTVGTWIAALEIRMHIDGCKLRHPRGHGWRHAYYLKRWAKRYRLSLAELQRLDRWAHFNSGPTKRTLLRYTRKLTERYAKLKRLACTKWPL
jgi:hypothetical protein